MRSEPTVSAELLIEARPVLALHSFPESHAAVAEAMLAGIVGNWSVELHKDCDGDLFLLLVPEGGDAAGASFVLHRDEDRIKVAATRGDVYQTLSAVQTIGAAIQRVRQHVEAGRGAWQTLHAA